MVPADASSMDGPDPRRRNLRWALLVFLLLTLLFNAGIVLHPGSIFGSPTADFSYHYWHTWWGAEAVAHLENPLSTRLLFHPDGAGLYWRDIAILTILAAAPITWIFGAVLSYNLIYLASFFLAGWGAWALVHYLTGSRVAALGAGIAYAFSPGHFLTYSQQVASHIQWIPFMVLCILQLRRERCIWFGVWAGVWLAASLLGSLYYGIYSALLVAGMGLWFLVVPSERVAEPRPWLKGLLACFVTAGVLTIFRTLPMILEALRGTRIEMPSPGTRADLLGMTVRSGFHATPEIYSWPAFFGIVVTLGALLGVIQAGWRRTRLWVAVGLGFFSIALGNTLRVGGREFPAIPMPADVLHRIPFLTSLRAYHRASVFVILALSVLYGMWLAGLMKSTGRGRKAKQSVAILAVLLSIIEFLPPSRHPDPRKVPPFYRELQASPDTRAVLAIPFDGEVHTGLMQVPMFFQTVHGKPLVAGQYGRLDPAHRERLESSSFLKRFLAEDPRHPTIPFDPPTEAQKAEYLEELRAWGIGWVILQRQFVREEGSLEEARKRAPAEVELGTFLLPIWWGPSRDRLLAAPDVGAYEYPAAPTQQYLHPSVVGFLKAVLGEDPRELEDGSLVWEISRPQ